MVLPLPPSEGTVAKVVEGGEASVGATEGGCVEVWPNTDDDGREDWPLPQRHTAATALSRSKSARLWSKRIWSSGLGRPVRMQALPLLDGSMWLLVKAKRGCWL